MQSTRLLYYWRRELLDNLNVNYWKYDLICFVFRNCYTNVLFMRGKAYSKVLTSCAWCRPIFKQIYTSHILPQSHRLFTRPTIYTFSLIRFIAVSWLWLRRLNIIGPKITSSFVLICLYCVAIAQWYLVVYQTCLALVMKDVICERIFWYAFWAYNVWTWQLYCYHIT